MFVHSHTPIPGMRMRPALYHDLQNAEMQFNFGDTPFKNQPQVLGIRHSVSTVFTVYMVLFLL